MYSGREVNKKLRKQYAYCIHNVYDIDSDFLFGKGLLVYDIDSDFILGRGITFSGVKENRLEPWIITVECIRDLQD